MIQLNSSRSSCCPNAHTYKLVLLCSLTVVGSKPRAGAQKAQVMVMDHDILHSDPVGPLTNSPELRLIYETAPIGLAFLSTDCRYVMINQHLTEICGLSIANHIGRTVRETVPQVA